MMRSRIRFVVALGAAATLTASAGTTHVIECPTEIPQTSLAIENPPAGWTPFARTGLRLSSAEPMFGPPSEKGFLKPSSSTATRDVWNELKGVIEGGKWIACRYGERGEVILSKRIADATSACTVVANRGKQGVNHPEVTCVW
ncbi:STY0301 family protein [Duganella sp. CF517]|uniref:STY0301 family protein n=1 Tax=Duganella sp. CF517 TaxID=1881038 RepID=UPI001160B8D1|nr:STY0301 family protein [Duganella sp. CF517]